MLRRRGWQTSSFKDSGNSKSSGPSVGQGCSSVLSLPSFTNLSHANGRMNLALSSASSCLCRSRVSASNTATSAFPPTPARPPVVVFEACFTRSSSAAKAVAVVPPMLPPIPAPAAPAPPGPSAGAPGPEEAIAAAAVPEPPIPLRSSSRPANMSAEPLAVISGGSTLMRVACPYHWFNSSRSRSFSSTIKSPRRERTGGTIFRA
mmetsp:Transcript_2916/g.7075  ORF Transcript_2916/g.7075 Transcript_2916/m.7075 type:complete len:205 (+) Transcript_2916:617-1231(+)